MTLNTEKFYSRDLSWLRFNHRVLQEAADKRNPLYERIKFLAIFSSNLDEFFKVRVSDIRQIKKLDKKLRKKLITKPNKLLKSIKQEVDLQQDWFGSIIRDEILPELRDHDIHLIGHEDFSEEEKSCALDQGSKWLKAIDIIRTISHEQISLKNEAIYLVGHKGDQLLWVELPADIDRFATFSTMAPPFRITFIDDILKCCLMDTYQTTFYALKVSRDAELYIENEYSGDLLQKIEASLSNRDTGQYTRTLIDGTMPTALIERVEEALDTNDTDLIRGGTYHNLKDFFGFPNPSQRTLSAEPLPPHYPAFFKEYKSMFEAIDAKDRALFMPYQSFDPVIRLLREAADDPEVKKIKITLYRVSEDSGVAKALLRARENGKEVTAFIETKARFDEANNIKWGKRLREAGVKVIFSYPGIKVHSKIMLIEKSLDEAIIKRYAYIGTGNFNEKTARIYTDIGLMTAAKKITSEINQVFQVLDGRLIVPKVKRLLVSPFTTRSRFSAMIEKEIFNALSGKEAYIILKLNSLQDTQMIEALYRANNAGVKIKLIVRGICCLVPGVERQSENIEVISIVDRFLEHSRVYIFCNDGNEKMYIGSADWMTRNLDHRIEVVAPVMDEDIFALIRSMIKIQLSDRAKARYIDQEQSNQYVGVEPLHRSSQLQTYQMIGSLVDSAIKPTQIDNG